MKCNCSVYLTFLLRYPCFLVILALFFKLLEKYLKIIHKTCWHIFSRPPIGVTPSECLISCKMCSDKISLKLGMRRKYGIMYRHRQWVSVQSKTYQNKAKRENIIQKYLASYAAKLIVKPSPSYRHLLDSELQDSFEDMAWAQCNRDIELNKKTGTISSLFSLASERVQKWWSCV